MTLFDRILTHRGITSEQKAIFLSPNYDKKHDPFLLPDMGPAVERLVTARKNQERITIYGDYDIDGLTATTVLIDALASFGFEHVRAFIPNRFTEGYGHRVRYFLDLRDRISICILRVVFMQVSNLLNVYSSGTAMKTVR